MVQHAIPDRAPDQGLAIVRGQRPPAIGRIDQEPIGTADDEVARQPDPGKGQPETRGDLHLHDRKADRQSDATRDHLVEMAIRRIAVLGGGRPAKPELAVQDVVESGNHRRRRIAGVEADPDPLSDRIEPRQDRLLVDRPATLLGDQEGAEREIDLGLRSGDEASEASTAGRSTFVETRALVVHWRILGSRARARRRARDRASRRVAMAVPGIVR